MTLTSRKKQQLMRFLGFLAMALVTVVMLFPFYWMVITALKPTTEIFNYPPKFWPSRLHWENFLEALKTNDFLNLFKNSLIVTTCATTITVFINLLAGYAFAKFKFKGREFFFLVVLSTLMIPVQATMIPNFIIASKLKLVNTYIGLILPPCAEAFGLFLSRQFISDLPSELIEAARIDGASEFSIFWKIILPNCKSLISVLVIFTVMWRWNDFQWPLILISDSRMYTVQIGLAMLNGTNYISWSLMMSAAIISVVPVVVVFFIFQKQFVQGVAHTGIKG